MQCTVEHLSGSRRGQIEQFEGDRLTVGRNPTNTLKFDPAQDLDVSGDHAQLTVGDDGRLQLTDLGSKNGTFLNGQKIAGTVPCEPGSKIQFGKGGPEVKIVYQPGPKKAGATRMMLAQVQQDLEAQKAKAASSQKTMTKVAVGAALVLALAGVGVYLKISHSGKTKATETAKALAEDQAERTKKLEKYAKAEVAKADEAFAAGQLAMDEGRWEDAEAAFKQAKKLYVEAEDAGRERKQAEDILAAKEDADKETKALLARMDEDKKRQDEELARKMAELEGKGAEAEAELAKLRAKKGEGELARDVFAKFSPATCLIVAQPYVQPEGATKRTLLEIDKVPVTVEGTGVVIGENRIATAKHVVQPWKFDPRLLATVKKIKDEHKLDVKMHFEIYMAKDGKFEKAFDGEKNKIKLIPAHDTWEKEGRKVTIFWNEVETQVDGVKPHVQGVDDIAAIEIDGASFEPVEAGDIAGVAKLAPVVVIGAASEGSGAGRKVTTNYQRTEVSDTGDGSITLVAPYPESYAGAPIFTLDGKCVGVIGGIQKQTITVLPVERAKNLKLSGATGGAGGGAPGDTGSAETASPPGGGG